MILQTTEWTSLAYAACVSKPRTTTLQLGNLVRGKSMKIVALLILSGVLALVAFQFVDNTRLKTKSIPTPSTQKLQISTSFYPLYFFASEIGGEKADVTNITPSGSEPHDYEPTTQDIAKIEKSDVLILNGVGLEPWGDKVRNNLQNKKIVIVTPSEDLDTVMEAVENGKHMRDPHKWLSPKSAVKMLEPITDAFIFVDPQNKSYYQMNRNRLEKQFNELDELYTKGLADCRQKDIITSHAAFGYLAAAYSLNQISIAGLSPDEEPSAKQLVEMSKFAKEHNVKYIFFESLVSPKLSDTIASEIGAKTLALDPLEGLTEEEMKQGKNYFSVMEDNLKNLQTALECTK